MLRSKNLLTRRFLFMQFFNMSSFLLSIPSSYLLAKVCLKSVIAGLCLAMTSSVIRGIHNYSV